MYRTADTSLWDDPRMRGLSKDGKLLFFYLFTNRMTHVSGIYVITPPSIMHDTKLGAQELTAALAELEAAKGCNGEPDPLVYWDKDRYVMWVVNMFKHQGRGEKNIRSAAAHIVGLHNSPLIDKFVARYPEVGDYLVLGNGVQLFAGGAVYKSARPVSDGSPVVTVHEIVEMWNKIPGIKQCEQVGDTIKKRIAAAISKHRTLAWWIDFCLRIENSDFLCGRASPKPGSLPFVATLYWVTGPINIDRIMAGDFDGKRSATGGWKGKL